MITRFAPSPTGPLHLGHAYSAILAHDMAGAAGGEFLLRIDDIDQTRARPKWAALIEQNLAWLGLRWPTPVRRQSNHMANYRAALERLSALGVTYPCRCSRRDIAMAAQAPQEGVAAAGPDGPIYSGTCKARPMSARNDGDAIRLDMEKALNLIPLPGFAETGAAHSGHHALRADQLMQQIGDVVLAPRDFAASYHLSVVVDDAAQNISHVIRGQDLFAATFIHVLLQALLDLPHPTYHHHRLIRDADGKRLAKRDDARAISKYRAEGATPGDIRRMVGLDGPYSR